MQLDLNNDDGHISSNSEATSPRQKIPLSPKPSVNVVSLFRRNTTEFAASIRERYREACREQTDRLDTEIGEDALLSSPSRQGRCHSERSGGIIRRLTKKKATVTRSLSFHSHKTGEGMLCCVLLCNQNFSFSMVLAITSVFVAFRSCVGVGGCGYCGSSCCTWLVLPLLFTVVLISEVKRCTRAHNNRNSFNH